MTTPPLAKTKRPKEAPHLSLAVSNENIIKERSRLLRKPKAASVVVQFATFDDRKRAQYKELERAKACDDYEYTMRLRQKLIDSAVHNMNKEIAYVRVGGSSAIVLFCKDAHGKPNILIMKRKDINEYFENRRFKVPKYGRNGHSWEVLSTVKEWAVHPNRRQYTNIVNMPGAEVNKDTLNLFLGYGTKPRLDAKGNPDFSGKSCSKLLKHIKEVLCNNNEYFYKWVLGWLAFLIQHPTRKKEQPTALMFYGTPGAGKSIVADVMLEILGPAGKLEQDNSFLSAKFNMPMVGRTGIVADEAVFSGSRSDASKMKAFISNIRMNLEKKGVDATEIENFARIIAVTNDNHALHMDAQDRRWLALKVNPKYVGNHAYFDALGAEIANGGAEAFHAFLLNPALYADIRVNKAPDTADGIDQKARSLSSVPGYLYECLSNRVMNLGLESNLHTDWPEDAAPRVKKGSLFENYLKWASNLRMSHPERDSVFHRELQEILKVTQINAKGGRDYILPPLHEAREQFQKFMNCPNDPSYLSALWGEEFVEEEIDDSMNEELGVTNAALTLTEREALENEQIPF